MPAKNVERFTDFAVRSGLHWSAEKLNNSGVMTVAFIGGSVTAGAGASDEDGTSYRALTCSFLQIRFPQTAFTFVNAAIGGTDSTYGAFRLKDHVFAGRLVDLLFIEFAVNDAGERSPSVRAMEGIVRQAKRINPHIGICFIYVANQSGSKCYAGTAKPQDNVNHHEEVAEYYGIPSVHIASRIYRMITSGEICWEDLSGDSVHPNDFGYTLYARFLQEALEVILDLENSANSDPTPLPEPIDAYCYEYAGLVPPLTAESISGWRMVYGWSAEKTCNWTPPANIWLGEAPGASFQFLFTGSTAGIAILAGLDTGDVDVSIDNGPNRTVSLFDNYCEQFYRPKIILLADGLDAGPHTVKLRISEQKNERSRGHSIHLLALLINGQ